MHKKTIFFIVVLLLGCQLYTFSQIQATTSTGEEVLLYDNGTWKYKEIFYVGDVPTNKTQFEKSTKSSHEVKSKIVPVSVWIDKKKWGFKKGGKNDDYEFMFTNRENEIVGIIINEETEVDMEFFKEVALLNLETTASDYEVLEEEYRIVNGHKVLYLKIEAKVMGMKLIYRNYYFSTEAGSTQLVTFGTKKQMERYQSTSDELLSGLMPNTDNFSTPPPEEIKTKQ